VPLREQKLDVLPPPTRVVGRRRTGEDTVPRRRRRRLSSGFVLRGRPCRLPALRFGPMIRQAEWRPDRLFAGGRGMRAACLGGSMVPFVAGVGKGLHRLESRLILDDKRAAPLARTMASTT